MDKVSWIKDLVKAEQQMEETGIVDMSVGFDPERVLVQDTIQFLLRLKTEFVDAATSFNDMKPSTLGRIKIYGIAKTHADFMLFRNGFKMIFSFKDVGKIAIKFNYVGGQLFPSMGAGAVAGQGHPESGPTHEEHLLEAKWGPFHEIQWTYQGQPFKVIYMVRHFLTNFIKESAK